MIEISFVIPAYNVEKFIERCLYSIFSQNIDRDKYEVIVIDDGSTDGTTGLLDEAQKSHDNLIIVSQTNQGPSAARNKGIALSKGKYIWFVDSDDYIVKGSMDSLLGLVSRQPVDILYFRYNEVNLDGTIKEGLRQPVAKNSILTGKRALKEGFFPTSVCLALWNKKYLDSLSLQFNSEIMYAEDSLFSFQALSQSNNVLFIDDAYYVYERREGSSTTKSGAEKLLKQKRSDIIVSKSIIDLADTYSEKDSELAQLMEKHARKIIFGLTYGIFRNRKDWKKKGISRSLISEMEKYGMYPLRKPYGSFPKMLLACVLNKKSLFS